MCHSSNVTYWSSTVNENLLNNCNTHRMHQMPSIGCIRCQASDAPLHIVCYSIRFGNLSSSQWMCLMLWHRTHPASDAHSVPKMTLCLWVSDALTPQPSDTLTHKIDCASLWCTCRTQSQCLMWSDPASDECFSAKNTCVTFPKLSSDAMEIRH